MEVRTVALLTATSRRLSERVLLLVGGAPRVRRRKTGRLSSRGSDAHATGGRTCPRWARSRSGTAPEYALTTPHEAPERNSDVQLASTRGTQAQHPLGRVDNPTVRPA